MGNCKNSDDAITNIENLQELNYMTFKGGGGKGIAYLGCIDVLSHKDVGILPLKLPISRANQIPGHTNGIIGISGTSAGAITAYLAALGLTADQIRNESGLLPPKKNPNYDPNFDPNISPLGNSGTSENEDASTAPSSEEYMPGENVGGFNFEHFITTDTPDNGYKRAVVFDNATKRNKLMRCVDVLAEKLPKRRKNTKKVKDESADRALADGLPISKINNVTSEHTKKELKGLRKSTTYPCQLIGLKGNPELEKAVEELKKARKKPLFWATNIISNQIDRESASKSQSVIFRTMFKDVQTRNAHVYNILYDQGLFPGFAIQEYYSDLTSRRLPVSLGWEEERAKAFTPEVAGEMTFKEFFEYTGFDLVVGGLNVVTGLQRNFSKDCTPDFPVVAAVMMSMNIPGMFKPVYVDAEIDKSAPNHEALRAEYRGYYVDTGLANNIPFHAFDEKVIKHVPSKMSPQRVNQLILGLAVQNGPDPVEFHNYYNDKIRDPFFQKFKEEKDGKHLYKEYTDRVMTHEHDPDFPKENFFHLLGQLHAEYPNLADRNPFSYNGIPSITGGILDTTLMPMLGWLLNTVLLNSTVSQTREPGAYERMIDIYAYHIDIPDFKADPSLTEFCIRRARERTIKALKLNLDANKDF